MSRLSSMKTKVIVFVTVSALALLGLALNSFSTLNSVKVGSDAYNSVLASERLIADVLPPPAYLVEAYLTVQQIANNTDPEFDAVLRDRLTKLEANYSERQDFYIDAISDEDMTQALKVDSQAPAREFFTIVQDQLLPAVDAGAYPTAQALANNELRIAYEEHRLAIDRVVELATEDSRNAEQNATELVATRTNLLLLTVIVAFFVTALVGALVASAIIKPIKSLVRTATVTLPAMVERIRETGTASLSDEELAVHSNDELGEATKAFNSVIVETVEMAKSQADLRRTAQENFVNLGRRSQNLLSRQIQLIEKAEQGEDDPEVLDTLFKIDHLAARMRRNAESLLVLADRQPPRKRRGPVALDAVLRAGSSEIEQYQRVQITDGDVVEIDGQYAPELVHLFAELLENAVRFSSPDTDVRVDIVPSRDGCLVEITDQGIGLSEDDLEEANRRLTGGADLNEANYLGHFVVGRLAVRMGAKVHLEPSRSGGLTAVVNLPIELLASGQGVEMRNRPAPARRASSARAAAKQEVAQADLAAKSESSVAETPVPAPVVAPAVAPAVVDDAVDLASILESTRPNGSSPLPAPRSERLAPPGTLTAESFGLRKREAGSSLSKTQRASARPEASETTARSAESVRDRFSSFAAGKQQASAPKPTSSTPDEETH
jgi:signal transduction histidine kinase